ncbi:hypothetical protein EYF80_053350 [Liparis tanakae]|uniref:Uncharacterized protein n=1 Tax=Liparis tanakae TaxID=230148 RepID=A0A4Z2F5T6_9TELE|nr:hypothetical protein EYF80_053350 [Liparis tanakae]
MANRVPRGGGRSSVEVEGSSLAVRWAPRGAWELMALRRSRLNLSFSDGEIKEERGLRRKLPGMLGKEDECGVEFKG